MTTQVARIMKRDLLTAQEAVSRINAQMSQSSKATKADIVIKNEGDLAQLEANARTALDEIYARVSKRV